MLLQSAFVRRPDDPQTLFLLKSAKQKSIAGEGRRKKLSRAAGVPYRTPRERMHPKGRSPNDGGYANSNSTD
eukprot:scaffold197330_cov50-Prasinocladus_malaysianus.AAC.1